MGSFSWSRGPRRCGSPLRLVHALVGSRGPRGVAAFPAVPPGCGLFSAVPPVAAHSAACGPLASRGCSPVSGSLPGPGSRPSRGASRRLLIGLVPLGSAKRLLGLSRCRVHSPASSVRPRESSTPAGPVLRFGSLSGFWRACLSDGSGVLPSRSAGLDTRPLRDGFAATPSLLVTVNCPPMFLESGMGWAEVASQLMLPGLVLLPAQVFLPLDGLISCLRGWMESSGPWLVSRSARCGLRVPHWSFALALVCSSLYRFVVSVFRRGLPVR